MSRRGGGMNWDKINQQAKARGGYEPEDVARKRRTGADQKDEIRRLCLELGRPEPTSFPDWAYDARLEIERLSRVLETRRRMQR